MGALCSSWGPVLLRYLYRAIFVAFCFHSLYPCFFPLLCNLFCSPCYCFVYRFGRIERLKTKIFTLCCTQQRWVLWIYAFRISCFRYIFISVAYMFPGIFILIHWCAIFPLPLVTITKSQVYTFTGLRWSIWELREPTSSTTARPVSWIGFIFLGLYYASLVISIFLPFLLYDPLNTPYH